MLHFMIFWISALAIGSANANDFFPKERTVVRNNVEYIALEGSRLNEETGRAFGRIFFPKSKFDGKKVALQMHVGVECPTNGPLSTITYVDGWGVKSYDKKFVGREVFRARPLPAELFQETWLIFLSETSESNTLYTASEACRKFWQERGNWRFDPTYIVYGSIHQTALTNGKFSEHWIELDAIEFAQRSTPSINVPDVSIFDVLNLR